MPLGALFNMKLIEYLRETRGEMKHVSWPTRRQVIGYTAIVIVISLITAVFLGFFDFIFSFLLDQII